MGMGNDECFQLGLQHPENTENRSSIPPSFLPLKESMRMVRAGGLHSIALSHKGVPYTWGSGDKGALGRVKLNPNLDEQEPDPEEEEQERTPTPVTGFVRQDGTNEDGQIKQIAAGDLHSLFLSISGAVYMCGTYQNFSKTHFFSDQDGPNALPTGINQMPVHVFQMPGPAKAIYAGGSMNAAVLENGCLVTWGLGHFGELARGHEMIEPSANEPDLIIVKEDFLKPKRVVWQSNSSLKREIRSVSIGTTHLVVAAQDPNESEARIYTSGRNNYGQLGHGNVSPDTACHVLTPVEDLRNHDVFQVAAGAHVTMALMRDRRHLFSFGRAEYGQLGIGVIPNEILCLDRPTVPVLFPDPVRILEISAGASHAMATTMDGQLYTWGFSEEGATGHFDAVRDLYRPSKLCGIPLVVGSSGGSQHSLLLVHKTLEFRTSPPETRSMSSCNKRKQAEEGVSNNKRQKKSDSLPSPPSSPNLAFTTNDLAEDERLLDILSSKKKPPIRYTTDDEMDREDPTATTGVIDIFQMSLEGNWRCAACAVINDNNAPQCISCTTPR